MTSSESKKTSKKRLGEWLKTHSQLFQIFLSFGIAFISMLVGVLSNFAADSLLSKFSWQNLETGIAIFATFLTVIVALISLFYRQKNSKMKDSQPADGEKEGEND